MKCVVVCFVGEVCRKKWKYLKDQYRKELRMELKQGSSKYNPHWRIYKPMYFMKPHFKALLTAHGEADNSSIGDGSESAFEIENEPVIEDCTYVEDLTVYMDLYPDTTNDEYDDGRVEEENDIDIEDLTQEDDDDSGVVLSEEGKPAVKRIKLSEVTVSPPAKRMKLLEVSPPEMTSDEDSSEAEGSELFFKSLLPFMREMTNIQKLRVRNTIQNVILHELEEGAF